MPIAEMEDWLLANGLEAWIAQDESRSLRSATAEEVYPDLNESFAQVYARVLEQMGGAEHADPDEVIEETRRRMNSAKDVS